MSVARLELKSAAWTMMAATFLVAPAAQSQTVTAFKTGEATTGMSKQCYYNALGNQYTRTISSVALCPLSVQVGSVPAQDTPADQARMRTTGGTAFKTGENTTGMTKQCFYNYLGSQITRTVSAVTLCPLSINVGG